MKTVLYGRYSKGPEKTVTTTPSALAVNTYPTYAKSFELQGRSLVLNQQIYQIYNTIDPSLTGLTVTFDNGLLSVNGTADVTISIKLLDNNDLVANHIYYFNAPTGASTSGYRPYFSTSGDNYTTDSIITWTTGKGSFNIRVNGGTSTGFSYYPQFIDLTQMFGAGFEPTTVNQLKAIIDIDKYIPFNPGTFIHNNSTYEVNKWNQLVKLANTAGTIGGVPYTIDNGRLTFNGTCSASNNLSLQNIGILSGHKYLLTNYPQQMPISTTTYNTLQLYAQNIINLYITENDTVNGRIETASGTGTAELRARIENGQTYSTSFCPQVIDLTDIFGSGKEPSTVDECKLRFLSMGIDITKYQPYSPLGGQYCGYRNIWNEEWELGDFNSTTGVKESGSRIINTDYIPVLSNTNYYVNNTGVITVYYYDSNKVFLGYNNPSSGCFESLPNSAYINFRCSTTYGTTYKNDISIYQVSNKVDLGFNIWDGTGTDGVGMSTQSGSTYPSSSNFVTDYVGVIAGEKYYLNSTNWESWVCYYDANKTYLGYVAPNNQSIVTMSSTAFYVRLTGKLSTKSTACFNLSQTDTTKSPHNGDYRPYLMLRGIGSDFNVWDEEVESGYIDSSGIPQNHSTSLRSKNYCQCVGRCVYYGMQPTSYGNATAIAWYNSNKTFLSRGIVYNATITAPTDAVFFKVSLYNYGTTYKNDICINLSQPQTTINPHNGQYVPHLFDTYDSMSGILTRRIGAIDLGTLNYEYSSSGTRFSSTGISNFVKKPASDYVVAPILCSKYNAESVSDTGSYNGIGIDPRGYIYIKDTSLGTDPTAFKAAMKGVMLLYELNAYQVFTPIQYSGVDLGSLNWVYNSTYSNFYTTDLNTTIKRPAASNIIPNVRCSKYSAATQDNYSTNNTIKVINNGQVWIKDTSYGTDAAAFKTGMTGVMLTYQNNTPYKFGIVDMGTLSWTRVDVTGSGGYVFSTPATPLQMYKQSDNLWCSGYTTGHYNGTGSAIYNYGDKTIAQHSPSGEFNIYVRDDSYTSVSDFTNAVKGKILTYELSDSVSQTTITQPISFVAGKLGKQYGVVDLGSLNWSYSTAGFFLAQNLPAPASTAWGTSQKPDVWTSRYLSDAIWNDITASNKDKRCSAYDVQVRISDSKFTDATAFKNSLQGQYLIYKLADSATNPTYATAGNLIQKTKGDVGDVDFNLTYNTLLNENKFLISYNMGTSQSPDKRLINVGGILNA